MPDYEKTTWADRVTPFSPTNMNKIEDGIYEAIYRLNRLLATQEETSAGTDATKAVTAATLKGLWVSTAVASDTLRGSLDTLTETLSTTYVKKKQFTMNASGVFRVKFTIKSNDSSEVAYGRVFKNGVPFGTERGEGNATYSEYSEDLEFNVGDTCEIWIKISDAFITCYLKDFRIYFDMVRTLAFDITPELPIGADV